MATNTYRWKKNLLGALEPLIVPGNFAAGSSQAIKQGEILELTGNTNTEWVPIDSDFAGNANIAVAACEIASGDRAGFYPIIVPRPGDVFEYKLSTATAVAIGASLYYSDSETLAPSGSNALARNVGWAHYPYPQEHLSKGGLVDRGATIGTLPATGALMIGFDPDVSYFRALYPTT